MPVGWRVQAAPVVSAHVSAARRWGKEPTNQVSNELDDEILHVLDSLWIWVRHISAGIHESGDYRASV